jgi:rhamnosyltransferase
VARNGGALGVTRLPSATVAILTFNGETYLGAILDALRTQQYDGDWSVLVIDSGSTDRTLEIVGAHPEVRLHQIPNSDFGHGKTRNLAASLASTEFVAYLTHDAVPISPLWLSEIVRPMVDDDRVVAVMGKQVPRPDCYPLLKYEIQSVFRGMGPDFGTTIFYDDGTLAERGLRDSAAFYSDANSATRRNILLGPVPYRDVSYAEDQLFGRDLIDGGYRKAYAPGAAVEHSNDLTIAESGRRMREEVMGLREIGTIIPPLRRRGAFRLIVRGILADSVRIIADRDFGPVEKLSWLVRNPGYVVVKWTNYRRATVTELQRYGA